MIGKNDSYLNLIIFFIINYYIIYRYMQKNLQSLQMTLNSIVTYNFTVLEVIQFDQSKGISAKIKFLFFLLFFLWVNRNPY